MIKKSLLPLLAFTAVGGLLLSAVIASADAADRSICDGLRGRAFGLCRAGVAIGCADDPPADKRSCEIIEDKFEEETGGPPPWAAPPCPCWSQEEIDGLRDLDPFNPDEISECGDDGVRDWWYIGTLEREYESVAGVDDHGVTRVCFGGDCQETPGGGVCTSVWQRTLFDISADEYQVCKQQVRSSAADRGLDCVYQ